VVYLAKKLFMNRSLAGRSRGDVPARAAEGRILAPLNVARTSRACESAIPTFDGSRLLRAAMMESWRLAMNRTAAVCDSTSRSGLNARRALESPCFVVRSTRCAWPLGTGAIRLDPSLGSWSGGAIAES
jgi:hypothetical protein